MSAHSISRMRELTFRCLAAAVMMACGAAPVPAADKPCRVEIVEQGTGWPVPLVELRTTHNVRLISDNAGVIAVDLPELMGRETWFTVVGNGYEVKKDGFGFRGVRLTPRPGKTLRVEVTRTIIAKRLGRLTGAGLFAESRKTGRDLDWKDAGVTGCDSIQLAVHRGKLHWFWGDTNVYRYPLGVFHMSAATTSPRPIAEFKPPIKLKYDYFTDDKHRPRGVAKMPGTGPTWLGGFASLKDRNGKSRLVATYSKIKAPLTVYESGLCVWNEKTQNFDRLRVIWKKDETSKKELPIPRGHPVHWKDEAGKEWLLFGDPLPSLRCPATFEAWKDPKSWEPLKPQKTLRSTDGKPVKPHSGSIAWHPYRKRWVTVFMQAFGKPSAFGELWYAEADSPTGPWGTAVKVLSHANYTFYNPRIHDEWFDAKSPVLVFEGTYTKTFAKNPPATPRYDYNQILYRLDLDDPALKAAQP